MNINGSDTLHLFEFDQICEKIANLCRCSSSHNRAENLKPFIDRDELRIALLQTEEYRQTLVNRGYFPDTFFDDFEAEAGLLQIPGSVLNEVQVSLIRSASLIVNSILKFFKDRETSFPHLLLLSNEVYPTDEIVDLINAVIDGHAQVKDNASEELSQIRYRHAVLQHGVAVPHRHGALEFGFFGVAPPTKTESVVIHRHTKRGAHLIVAAVRLADVSPVLEQNASPS